MTYPPAARVHPDPAAAVELMRRHQFAHFVTSHGGLNATRIPLVADVEGGAARRLRGHLNAANPQAQALDGQEALIVFDGPSTYVSPNWRTDLSRAATYDYEQVQVRGVVRVQGDIAFFRRMVDDLAALIEPQYAEVGDYPAWRAAMAPAGYVERLFPAITAFTIEITAVQMISKLHQTFPQADRRSIADHLDRCAREDARAIAAKIRAGLEG